MSFQAYLDTIEKKTGKSAADLRRLGEDQGWTAGGTMAAGIKATTVTDWLKAELGLGHGHARAVYALLKGHEKEGD